MVDRLCTSLAGLSLSAIRRYTALAAEREDCIALTIGEPDLPTPAPICEAAVRALAGGSTHYTTNQGSAPVIRKLTALHWHILTCAPSMLQAACETALGTDAAPMRETYAKRRALVLRRLHAMGLCCPVPEGAFYAFPDIRAFGLCSEAFCLRLIAEAGVAAVPGSCFGTEGHIRISYCCGEQTLERGMDRLEAFLEKLKQERRT